MSAKRRVQILGGAGLFLLCWSALLGAWQRSLTPLPGRFPTPVPAALPVSPAEIALRQARQYRWRAEDAVRHQLEALAEWDADALQGLAPQDCRQQILVASRDLQEARRAAERAAALAQTSNEIHRATRLLARIDCDRGHHQSELKEARKLMRLAPQNRLSVLWLRRAARCNRLKALERQADATLAALDRVALKAVAERRQASRGSDEAQTLLVE